MSDLVRVESPEGPEWAIEVAAELAPLVHSLMFGEFDVEDAKFAQALVSVSFGALEGMEAFIAVCLRPLPDGLSERITGRSDDGQAVRGAWRYALAANAIFAADRGEEANIAWSASVRFPRSDLAEVEERVRVRPAEFLVFADEPRSERSGKIDAMADKDQSAGAAG